MDLGDIFVIAIVWSGIVCFITEEKVDNIQSAITVCETNEGLKSIEVDFFTFDAVCNNGAIFTINNKA